MDSFRIDGDKVFIGDTEVKPVNIFRDDLFGQRGFHLETENGLIVSVQFGAMNYCDNKTTGLSGIQTVPLSSPTAEIAYWPAPNGRMLKFEDGDEVQGWQTPQQVLDFIKSLSAKSLSAPQSLSHEDVLNKILAATCVQQPIGDDEIRTFRIDCHCVTAVVKARLKSTYREIQYDILDLSFE